jgi:hypothetical protein
MLPTGTNRGPLSRAPWLKALAATALASPFAAAAIAFALARPVCETELPATRPHPAGEHDLASYLYGPTIAASTANLSTFNHPSFVVDGLKSPSKTARWVSQRWDRAPWIEIRFRGAHDVERVALSFGRAPGMRDYDVRCLGGPFPPLAIRGNRDAEPSHALACRAATGIRVDFRPRGHEVASATEIEVLGR